MNEFFILDICIAILAVMSTLIFVYAVYKRRDLISWLPAYVTIAIGQVAAPFSVEKG